MNVFSRTAWLLAGLLALPSLSNARAAGLGERDLLALRQFQYGAESAVLADIEKRVAEATAQKPGSSSRASLAQALARILETDASDEAKQFVCRQLAIIGTGQQIPVLARLLEDEKRSDMARYALAPMPDPAAGKALRDALGRAVGKTRIGIINSIAFRKDVSAVESLGALLNSTDTECAKAAAGALGQIGGTEAAAFLKPALNQSTPATRSDFTDACLTCAERLIAQGKPEAAEGLYRDLFSPTYPSWTRAAALRGLVGLRSDGVRLATTALRDEDPILIRAGIGCIQAVPGADATRRFAAELPNLPSRSQATLLNALAERGDATALPAVKDAVNNADPVVRLAAVQALGILGDSSVVDTLVPLVNEPPPVGTAALNGLRAIRSERANAAIANRLGSERPEIRIELINVLADRQAEDAAPALIRLLDGSDPGSAVASAKALGQIASTRTLEPLLNVLASTDSEPLREAVEQAAVAVSRPLPQDQQADLVLKRLQGQTPIAVKCSLLRVLGGIGSSKSLDAVRDALNDSNESVRDAAVRALADWPAPSAIDPLRLVFEKAANPAHRALALRGLVRLADPSITQKPAARTLELYTQLMPELRDADEIRLALSGLAAVNEPQALALIEPHLSPDATREEAAAATAKVAASIAAASPDLARRAAERTLAVSKNPDTRKQAGDVLRELERSDDYIMAWQLAGPFEEAGKDASQLFDTVFPPEKDDAVSVQWRAVTASLAPQQPAIVDLMGLLGGSQRVAYLRTRVHSEQKQPARLELGSDDGIKAWLNGAVVHSNNVDRGLNAGQDQVPITLNKGWNELLLKVTQGGGGWAACARIRNPEGDKLSGLRFDAKLGPEG